MQHQAEEVHIGVLDRLLVEEVMGHEADSSLYGSRRHEMPSDRIRQVLHHGNEEREFARERNHRLPRRTTEIHNDGFSKVGPERIVDDVVQFIPRPCTEGRHTAGELCRSLRMLAQVIKERVVRTRGAGKALAHTFSFPHHHNIARGKIHSELLFATQATSA